jgi:hypothetical protein
MSEQPDQLWVAYYHDWSGFAVFDREILALRHAVERNMAVKQIAYGEDIKEQVR